MVNNVDEQSSTTIKIRNTMDLHDQSKAASVLSTVNYALDFIDENPTQDHFADENDAAVSDAIKTGSVSDIVKALAANGVDVNHTHPAVNRKTSKAFKESAIGTVERFKASDVDSEALTGLVQEISDSFSI